MHGDDTSRPSDGLLIASDVVCSECVRCTPLSGLAAPAASGFFCSSLAHAAAHIKQGGSVAQLSETGVALLGAPMAPKSGRHWVELRVLEASMPAGAHVGVLPEDGDKASVMGVASGSVGMHGGGAIVSGGATLHQSPLCAFARGDLLRIEYDSTEGSLTYTKNGESLAHPPVRVGGGAAAPALYFGIGRTEGLVEMRVEGSSFAGQAGGLQLPLEDEGDTREARASPAAPAILGIRGRNEPATTGNEPGGALQDGGD